MRYLGKDSLERDAGVYLFLGLVPSVFLVFYEDKWDLSLSGTMILGFSGVILILAVVLYFAIEQLTKRLHSIYPKAGSLRFLLAWSLSLFIFSTYYIDTSLASRTPEAIKKSEEQHIKKVMGQLRALREQGQESNQ